MYDEYYRCDAYELYGVMWFRITTASRMDAPADSEATAYTIDNYDEWYDRDATYSTLICGPHDYRSNPT